MWLALLISLSITRLIKDCLIYIYKKAYPTIASNAIELKRNTTPLVVDVQLMNPSDIETRQEFGHFEAVQCFLVSARGQNVATFVERKSCLTI